MQVQRNNRLVKLKYVYKPEFSKLLASKTCSSYFQNITYLSLCHFGVYSETFFETLHKSCKRITHLTLDSAGGDDLKEELYVKINQAALHAIGKFQLIKVEFIRILFTCSGFRNFFSQFPQMQKICFDDCRGCDGAVDDITATCQNLTSFSYEFCMSSRVQNFVGVLNSIQTLRNLLSRITEITNKYVI